MFSFKNIFCFLLTIYLVVSECPYESLAWKNYCYFFSASNASATFYEAEFNCIALSGNLVSIHDGLTNGLLDKKGIEHFHESTMSDFWIGLNKLIIPGNWSWTDSSPFDFNEWATSEPSNLSLNCVSFNLNNGFWQTSDCYLSKPYICEVEKTIYDTTTILTTTITTVSPTLYPLKFNCSSNYYYFAPTHSCYGIEHYLESNWSFAEINCENQKGRLASFHSYEEANFLSFADVAFPSGIWVGLYTIDNGITWRWSDGSPTDYLPWAYNHPVKNENCAYIKEKQLYSFTCSKITYSICKRPVI